MPSPFPGMNPYLEQDDAWHDFHKSLIPRLGDAVAAQVDPRYIAKINAHVYVRELPVVEPRWIGRSDVEVADPRQRGGLAGTVATLVAPCEGVVPAVDVERISFVEVRDRRNRQLITVIEVLSPTNKRSGPDRDQYLAKRAEILASNVHFVEIDLLRLAGRMPIENVPPCHYCIMVSRVEKRPKVDLWPLNLRDRLPVIPIPLRTGDTDARADVQELLDAVYDAAHYGTYVYDGQPEPPLSAEDAAWASHILNSP